MFLGGSNPPKNFNPYSYGWAQSRLPMTWEQARKADAAIEARKAEGRQRNQEIFDARDARRKAAARAFAPTMRTNIALRR